jgi:hypothetical protein
MRRIRIWTAAAVVLAAVLTTGLLVVAQSPTPTDNAANVPPPTVSPVSPNPVGIVPLGAPTPNWQMQRAQPVPAPNFQPQSPASIPVPPPPPKTNGDLIHELIQIINETRSVDTFFVTTKLLEDMGAKSRVAVPAIIRNAERLELFKDSFFQTEKDGEKPKRLEMASLIVDSLGKILSSSQAGSTTRPPVNAVPAPLSPPATKRDPNVPLVPSMSGRTQLPPSVGGISLR